MRLGYNRRIVDALPDVAVESFCGVGNPFTIRKLKRGERVVDVGCGAGFDCILAAKMTGPSGLVVGVDLTQAMLDKARMAVSRLSLTQTIFRKGRAEDLPVASGWADSVISNGVFTICADKPAAIRETWRCLRPGGYLQFADVSFPASTQGINETQGFFSVERWVELLEEVGFVQIAVGPAVDSLGDAPQPNGTFSVFGYSFAGRRPCTSSDLAADRTSAATRKSWV